MNELELRAAFHTHTRYRNIARGAIRRLRPHVLDSDARAHVEQLKENSEPFRRMGKREHDRVRDEVQREQSTARRRAASVALHHLRAAEQHVNDWRRWVQASRRDVSLSMPAALAHVSADGMISLALLRERRRSAVLTMTADQMLACYERACATKDAPAFVDAQLIEDVVQNGTGLALDAEDLPTLRKLREYISGIQDLRVPTDLPDYEALAADIESLHERADALQISPLPPEHDAISAAAYREQESTLLEIGTRSDREDLQAVQQELAKASGE